MTVRNREVLIFKVIPQLKNMWLMYTHRDNSNKCDKMIKLRTSKCFLLAHHLRQKNHAIKTERVGAQFRQRWHKLITILPYLDRLKEEIFGISREKFVWIKNDFNVRTRQHPKNVKSSRCEEEMSGGWWGENGKFG